ncbi:hypothetical protein BAUCODRAFT_511620 [Baudoinia panamericana UAMH 10762]|uniref:Uncharacterized protein n=1 Tax=Baudoinia panamericana (strain UAMH 10762) TaxID=717646 RepID=M2LNQ3_BAUPA|nr:uncharacterized protein BAUCODRAFT_511620 [Baudoinia panamericana UAMH 10762]EMC95982.1 hypothetical protein BAUCODRAFT_511620 [Baudoinia panamericana UAMH 10762]
MSDTIPNVQGAAPVSSTSTLTSTSVASSSNATHSGSSSGSGVTTGALAGGIVGAALGAAVLTFLLTSLIWLNRTKSLEKSYRRSHRAERTLPRALGEKSNSPEDPNQPSWEFFLPQPADDETVRSAVKALFDEAMLHVENFYSRRTAHLSPEMVDHLALMQTASPELSGPALMSKPRSAWPGIKHCLAYMLAEAVDPTSSPAVSLLPLGWTLAAGNEDDPISKSRVAAKQQAISKWRQLTAFLHPQPYNERAFSTWRDKAIIAHAERFEAAFRPWQADMQPSAHEDVLHIMRSAADVAVLLFSQPSGYVFRWQAVSGQSGSNANIVVIPDFIKVTDESGMSLSVPQTMVKMVAERI